MKSYNMHDSTSPAQKADAELIAKHKREREGGHKKTNSIEATQSNPLDNFDDIVVDESANSEVTIIDEDGDGYADVIVDSKGERIEIKNAMWESKGKKTKYQEKPLPSWQRSATHMSVKDWLMFLIPCMVPGLNVLIFLYVGYLSSTSADEKRNYCRANIILVFLFICTIVIMALTMDGFRQALINIVNSMLKQ